MPKKIAISKNKKKKPVIYGTRLSIPAGVAARYNKKLQALVKRMTTETTREIKKLFASPASHEYIAKQKAALAMDASIASQARILMNALTDKFDKLFADKSWEYAEQLVNDAARTSRYAVQESLKTLSGGLTLKLNYTTAPLKEVLKSTTFESVSLIKSIPSKYFDQVQGDVMRAISGGGVGELYDSVLKYPLEKYNKTVEGRAKFIAEDQTRKTYNAVTAQRSIGVGIEEFEWLHSGGGLHPRPDHVAMNGNIYRYDDLPVINEKTGEVGLPGQLPNCRCVQRPVITFQEGDEDDGES